MLVQEARILELSLYETIQRNLARLDFSAVLPDIMLIADEVDSQLTQTIDGFLKDAGRGAALQHSNAERELVDREFESAVCNLGLFAWLLLRDCATQFDDQVANALA